MSSSNRRKRQRNLRVIFLILCAILVVLIGVLVHGMRKDRAERREESRAESVESGSASESTASSESFSEASSVTEAAASAEETSSAASEETSSEAEAVPTAEPTAEPTPEPTEEPAPEPTSAPSGENGHIVAVDAGHQLHSMEDKEPIGPGSEETKTKVSTGTYGEWSGLNEYELTLTVALKLKEELAGRGYRVVMTRESHDVTLSNIDRAEIANDSGAEIMVRIHGNSVDDSSVYGALCFTADRDNPYLSESLISESIRLSEDVVNAFCESTGAKNSGVSLTNNLTGMNWSKIPCTYIEMGFMSNQEEDLKMADESYQALMVTGIANGIDRYFNGE